MKVSVIIAVAVFMAPVLRAQVAEEVFQDVKAAFEKKLPDGWAVMIDVGQQWIDIEKEAEAGADRSW